MFKHIVVAVDFSPAREILSSQLPKLRGWGCERMTLAHVLASHYPQAPAETHRAHYEHALPTVPVRSSVPARPHKACPSRWSY